MRVGFTARERTIKAVFIFLFCHGGISFHSTAQKNIFYRIKRGRVLKSEIISYEIKKRTVLVFQFAYYF